MTEETFDSAQHVPIGIIGGSGLYDIDGLTFSEQYDATTPFGRPSAPIRVGTLEGRRLAFIPRHGDDHALPPTSVPNRANFWALKKLGVFWVLSISAVGSLKEQIVPGEHLVVPDQIVDKTFDRNHTFYEDVAVHVGISRPYDPRFREVIIESLEAEQIDHQKDGTYVCMEGPAFSTKAESQIHRSWGADLVGMTAMPEARLAREAEMAYATIALPTDYDVWYEGDEVEVSEVVDTVDQVISKVRTAIKRIVPSIPLGSEDETDAHGALEGAIMTAPDAVDPETRQKVGLFLDSYLEEMS